MQNRVIDLYPRVLKLERHYIEDMRPLFG